MADFYSLEEASRVLGMSPDELKAKAQHREVRAFLDGGSWRFRRADVDELARRRGLGSDPELPMSDLDLTIPSSSGSGIDFSKFQLGLADEDEVAPAPGAVGASGQDSDQDLLLDDLNVPPAPGANSSSVIIGMAPEGKRPSDSDVRLVPDNTQGSSDSDVRLAPASPR
jgi:excisionase family DNA binding protein